MTWLDDHIHTTKQKGKLCNWDPNCTAIVDGEETICIDCIDSYEASLEHDTYYDPLRPTPLLDDDSEGDPMPGYTPDPEWHCRRCENTTREPITKKMICHDCRGWEQFEDECMKDFGNRIGVTVVKVDAVPDIEDNQ